MKLVAIQPAKKASEFLPSHIYGGFSGKKICISEVMGFQWKNIYSYLCNSEIMQIIHSLLNGDVTALCGLAIDLW